MFASWEEKIPTTIRNTSAFQEIEDKKFHEKQEYIEYFLDYPYTYGEYIREPWTKFDQEKVLELEIE